MTASDGPDGIYLGPAMAPQTEQRRWTRLMPEILSRCRVRILSGAGVEAQLRDLSPGGIGLCLPPNCNLPATGSILVRVAFLGQPAVVREGFVRQFDPQSGLLSLAWPAIPPAWSGIERRSRPRVQLPLDALFARMPLRHAHRLWSRLRVIDLSSDVGFQVETLGGPGYLLPGHLGYFHLDFPLLTNRRWECQTLWCRPGDGQAIRMGVRILDPDADLAAALGEWLELDRLRSPLELRELGFRESTPQGQFRFRKIEESGERKEFDEFLQLPPEIDGTRIGVWDGHLLAGAVLLAPDVQDHGRLRVLQFVLRREWVVSDVFFGLWEQVVRHFLASGASALSIECPPGRESLFLLCGMHRKEALGLWTLTRKSVVWGRGMRLVRWRMLYGEVGGFALQHSNERPPPFDRFVRLAKSLGWLLLRDWQEPKERQRLHREIDRWANESTP